MILSAEEHDKAEADRIAANARRELGMEVDPFRVGDFDVGDRGEREKTPTREKTPSREAVGDKTPSQVIFTFLVDNINLDFISCLFQEKNKKKKPSSRQSGDKEKRAERSRRTSSPSPSRSEDATLSSPDRKKTKRDKRRSVEFAGEVKAAMSLNGGSLTSDLLEEHLWPDGYDRIKINKISLDQAMKLKKLQVKTKKSEDDRTPGVAISKPDKPIKMVNVAAGTDNATDVLHDVRFSLRPITVPPKKWWIEKMEKKRKDSPCNPSVSFLGASQQVNKL